MVVFIRPPGCVQVQPDLLISKSQPSPSKHGSISHHCFVLIIRAMKQKRKNKKQNQKQLAEEFTFHLSLNTFSFELSIFII